MKTLKVLQADAFQPALDNYSKATDAFKQALAIDPGYFEGVLNLGYVLMQPALVSYNTANQLPANQQKQYLALRAKANEQFDVAKPALLESSGTQTHICWRL